MITTGTELCVLCELRSEAKEIVFITVIIYDFCEVQVAVEETTDHRACNTSVPHPAGSNRTGDINAWVG